MLISWCWRGPNTTDRPTSASLSHIDTFRPHIATNKIYLHIMRPVSIEACTNSRNLKRASRPDNQHRLYNTSHHVHAIIGQEECTLNTHQWSSLFAPGALSPPPPPPSAFGFACARARPSQPVPCCSRDTRRASTAPHASSRARAPHGARASVCNRDVERRFRAISADWRFCGSLGIGAVKARSLGMAT